MIKPSRRCRRTTAPVPHVGAGEGGWRASARCGRPRCSGPGIAATRALDVVRLIWTSIRFDRDRAAPISTVGPVRQQSRSEEFQTSAAAVAAQRVRRLLQPRSASPKVSTWEPPSPKPQRAGAASSFDQSWQGSTTSTSEQRELDRVLSSYSSWLISQPRKSPAVRLALASDISVASSRQRSCTTKTVRAAGRQTERVGQMGRSPDRS